jgi:hypothetical protein
MLCLPRNSNFEGWLFRGGFFLGATFLVVGHIHVNMVHSLHSLHLRMFLGEDYERQFHQMLDEDFWSVIH